MSNRHIICFGNDLQGDDGFGQRVYTLLCQLVWPEDIMLYNAGIAGLNALGYLQNCQQAILVDALANFGQIGELFLLKPEELADRPQSLSSHGLGLAYLLAAVNSLPTVQPDIVIVGVEIASIQPFYIGLSDSTEQAASKAVEIIQALLS